MHKSRKSIAGATNSLTSEAQLGSNLVNRPDAVWRDEVNDPTADVIELNPPDFYTESCTSSEVTSRSVTSLEADTIITQSTHIDSFAFFVQCSRTSGIAESFDLPADLYYILKNLYSDQGKQSYYDRGQSSALQNVLDLTSNSHCDADLETGSEPTHVWGYPVSDNPEYETQQTLHQPAEQLLPYHTDDWLANRHLPRNFNGNCRSSTRLPFQKWSCHPLAFKTDEIVASIRQISMHKVRNSIISFDWSSLIEETCFHFFHPVNLQRFLDLFWITHYPHWPIVHKPTFEASSTSCTLLTVMTLLGACASPEPADHEAARMWLNAVEEVIFTDYHACIDNLRRQEYRDNSMNLTSRMLHALQAAHGICILQTWEGTNASKQRIRRCRFSTVVAVRPIDSVLMFAIVDVSADGSRHWTGGRKSSTATFLAHLELCVEEVCVQRRGYQVPPQQLDLNGLCR